ncbi:S-adenosyl-L-homocysteine hydrolase [Lunatimonas lonarensis]|uniref:S-adenosyl-L-homocysteine hydrolase n=1 Tax=Lunatimonas lonarensis TaxID=1232681 RepID=R7ZL11_9BACT|nr:hypothetical protein [Lunatimonas lonarensis]EON74780.1 S-adenosyl-L-homocysteine hydrolase [Lunatimonas lonarensis]
MNRSFLPIILLLIAVGGPSCQSDQNIRLETDQSFEGEELYLVSKVLDEHLPFILQRPTFFLDESVQEKLSDCPVITIESFQHITLTFDPSTCPAPANKRKGKIDLFFSNTPMAVGEYVVITYDDYVFENHPLEGRRTLKLTAINRERRVYEEVGSDIMVTNPNNHSTRIRPSFTFEIAETGGNLSNLTVRGGALGRNRGGKTFEINIAEQKSFNSQCVTQPVFRPVSGVERWEIARSSTGNVVHQQTFHTDGECLTHAIIRLHEGVEMKKTP